MNLLKFIPVAKTLSTLSKDPSTKVGAIILDDDGNTLATGYNGFPRGVIDRDDRYSDRETKLKFIAHSEANAIAQAARVGSRLLGSNLIVTELYPCSQCTKLIIQSGIKRVYTPLMDIKNANPQWFKEKELSELMFKEAGVDVVVYDCES